MEPFRRASYTKIINKGIADKFKTMVKKTITIKNID